MIDTRELMRQVGRLRIVTNRLVDERFAGAYHSVFKGRGIEFDEVREYVSGDDVRAIDWNVTARMGHPFIKRFAEERELTILFAVDTSGSLLTGSTDRLKAETAAELACLLALSAIKNQDNVGLLLFSDAIGTYLPPRKGRKAALRLVREILAAEETGGGTDIAGALTFLNRVQKRRAIVFLISDFLADNYDAQLRITARRHDLICCHVSDPREMHLPPAGLIELEDPETGALVAVDTASPAVREQFTAQAQAAREALLTRFRRYRIDTISASTDQPFIDALYRLFSQRQDRARRGLR